MPGIGKISVAEFQARIDRFDQRYVQDWIEWLNAEHCQQANLFGAVLRRWQACRPNRMRRLRSDQLHDAPYLNDLIAKADPHLLALQAFNIRKMTSFTRQARRSLVELWAIFQNLTYHGRARNGLAGVVGISKAVLLLTKGRVGPAFDSQVRGHLGIKDVNSAEDWIDALRSATQDIEQFESTNKVTLYQAVPPRYAELHCGRIYDMALGPGAG